VKHPLKKGGLLWGAAQQMWQGLHYLQLVQNRQAIRALLWVPRRCVVHCCWLLPMLVCLQDKLNASYAELSGAFKTSLEGLARTVQDLHAIIK
jgi:hypothetical protein